MTFEELEAIPKEWLTPEQVAEFIGCSAQSIRSQAQIDVAALGFPCTLILSRTLIPKRGFVEFVSHGRPSLQKRSERR